ncbi:MAG: dipeptide ABC transporter ATP-binding protein [Alphaproteobacteria bacterium]|nr:dipeptide ABC transporter ATP-binding protein [Alphaproteobacteria bacterium]
MTAPAPLIEVDSLVKHFPIRKGFFSSSEAGTVRAVDGISFTVARGETLGLVGESGCGKSTTGRLMLRLIDPTSGALRYDGTDLAQISPKQMRERRRELQIIFQDPYSSLNPRMTVESIITEPLVIHGIGNAASRRARAHELLDIVGLARSYANRYPHEFSGGQRQRIGIARALALRPQFVVCDEPVSALDVSIQAQVINLMQDLQKEFGLTYLFISHNLAVIRHIADRVAVMYLGKIVELTDKHSLYTEPKHPYTQALLSAIPIANPDRQRQRVVLTGDVPSPINPPAGCRFHTRCPYAEARCKTMEPPLIDVGGGHRVACHLVQPSA